MTTAEVCEVLVLPRTEGTSKAFIDLEPYCQKTDLQGRPYVASATVFVSHAWRYNCSELLSAILDHAANSEDYEYYWFDLVCNDQHDAPTMPHSWWSATFKEAILSMKEVRTSREYTCACG